MPRLKLTLVLLLYAACATSRVRSGAAHSSDPHDEAARAEADTAALASAFDAPEDDGPAQAPALSPQRPADPAARGDERPVHPLQPQQRLEDARVEARAAFERSTASGDDLGVLWGALDRWLSTCGPEKVDRCRLEALRAAERALKRAKAPAGPRRRLAGYTDADACVRRLEATRARAPLPSCAASAAALYRRTADELMQARLALAKALHAAGDDKRQASAIAQLRRIESICTAPRCEGMRRRALKRLAALALAASDLATAARATLLELRLEAAGLPPERREYARSSQLDRVCERLDQERGEGTCRRLEKELLGDYVFRDYSKSYAGEALDTSTVRQVNEHFGFLARACLQEEAARLAGPAQVTYALSWSVGQDGRVQALTFERPEQDRPPLGPCLRAQFSRWRYPRFGGETQHVQQTFTLQASGTSPAGRSVAR